MNDFYPDLIEQEKDYWPARLDAGLLYLEKFNQADAAKEFHKAAAINPNAAEVHAALGRLGDSELRPGGSATGNRSGDRNQSASLLWAHQLQADVHLANFDSAQAIETLEGALKLNPGCGRNVGSIGRGDRSGKMVCPPS